MKKTKGIGWFIGGRVLQFVLILLAASVLIFAMCHISDIDPVAVILGGKQTSAETIAALREKFHLNDSLPQQYLTWISGMVRGDFGLDFKYQQPVWNLIAGRLPVTLSLTLLSSVMAMIIAIPLGVVSGVKSHTARCSRWLVRPFSSAYWPFTLYPMWHRVFPLPVPSIRSER